MFDEEERLIYEIRMQSLADIESIIVSANDKGFGQGMERGMEQGLEQGLERGMQQGVALTALNMLAKGMSTEDIADVTGLSTAVIQQLASTKIS